MLVKKTTLKSGVIKATFTTQYKSDKSILKDFEKITKEENAKAVEVEKAKAAKKKGIAKKAPKKGPAKKKAELKVA